MTVLMTYYVVVPNHHFIQQRPRQFSLKDRIDFRKPNSQPLVKSKMRIILILLLMSAVLHTLHLKNIYISDSWNLTLLV